MMSINAAKVEIYNRQLKELESGLAAEQEAHAATKQQLAVEQVRQENFSAICRERDMWKQRAEAAEARIKASREQEPVWYAVMSIEAPVVNRAIRSLDGAHEYAAGCRENYGGVNIVDLYVQPPIPPEVAELQRQLEEARTVPTFADFNAWMQREIPSGTIIGDAGWWAARIYKRFIAHITDQPKEQTP